MNDEQPTTAQDDQAPKAPAEAPQAAPADAAHLAQAATAPAADSAPQVNESSTEDAKAALVLHLLDLVTEAQARRAAYRSTPLIIKEDRYIQHLQGIIGTLRQLSLKVF